MDDVHHLQDHAGADLLVPLARGHEHEVFDRELGDRAGDGVLEIAAQIGDRFVLDRVEARAVCRTVDVELLHAEELLGVVAREVVQALPVDDRVAAEDVPDRFEVAERELIDGAKARRGRRGRRPDREQVVLRRAGGEGTAGGHRRRPSARVLRGRGRVLRSVWRRGRAAPELQGAEEEAAGHAEGHHVAHHRVLASHERHREGGQECSAEPCSIHLDPRRPGNEIPLGFRGSHVASYM